MNLGAVATWLEANSLVENLRRQTVTFERGHRFWVPADDPRVFQMCRRYTQTGPVWCPAMLPPVRLVD